MVRLVLICPLLLLSSCYPTEPTYKEKDIPFYIQKICKEEYGLEVIVQRAGDTIWIYAPMQKLLHKKFGIEKDKTFDEGVIEKLIHILTSINRVTSSSDKAPLFYCLTASDIELGIDYSLTGYVLDIKKLSSGAIPFNEANKRYVIKLNLQPNAIGDKMGAHLNLYDIKLTDFLIEQIAQRIRLEFQGEQWKDYFKIDSVEGKYQSGVFTFTYDIKQLAQPPKPINLQEEITEIIALCLRIYEFHDFLLVNLTDLVSGDKVMLGRSSLEAIKGF